MTLSSVFIWLIKLRNTGITKPENDKSKKLERLVEKTNGHSHNFGSIIPLGGHPLTLQLDVPIVIIAAILQVQQFQP